MEKYSNGITNLNEIEFVDYTSFKELSNKPQVLNNLIACYCEIFSEPDVWAEDYSKDEILTKLKKDMSGYASMRICINTETEEVIGFCWAQLLTSEEIHESIKEVHYYQKNRSVCSDNALGKLIAEDRVVYVQDLGISKQYRGTVPLEKLILPVLIDLVRRTEINDLFFWSVEDTCVAWIAKKVNIDVVYDIKRMQFFAGKLPIPIVYPAIK